MSAQARRLMAVHAVIACTAMLLCTLLAVLHDIPGSDALTMILACAGISGSGAASASTVDRAWRQTAPTRVRIPRQGSGE